MGESIQCGNVLNRDLDEERVFADDRGRRSFITAMQDNIAALAILDGDVGIVVVRYEWEIVNSLKLVEPEVGA